MPHLFQCVLKLVQLFCPPSPAPPLGIEDAIIQLTSQMSRLQQQVDEKRQRLSSIQFQLQGQALDQTHLQPGAIAYNSSPTTSPRASRGDDPLPDFGNLSLEGADWFQEGIPR